MAKINLKQPKFIVPLILLPFLFIGYYVFDTFKARGGGTSMTMADSMALVKEKGLNADMPKVSKDVSSSETKDKFGAYSEAFKNEKDYTALNPLDNIGTGDKQKTAPVSSYSNADIQRIQSNRKLDSMRVVMEQNRAVIQQRINSFPNPAAINNKQRSTSYQNNNDQSTEIMEALRRNANMYGSGQTSLENPITKKPGVGTYDEQMRFFRDQIKMVDSMQKANKPAVSKTVENNGENQGAAAARKFDPSKDTSFKPLHVSVAESGSQSSSGFNTIRKFKQEDNIRAIVDEAKKVTAGARVRIRLLQDIFVGENVIPAGTFLYGIVTGFQTQRVNISITSINQNGNPLHVKLDVFDSDGYLGLYVPGSNFREFSKEVGTQSTSGLSQVQVSSGSTSDIQTSLMSKVFQSTTNTVGKLISQNKATLKSDYIIYLKENKSSNKN